MRRSFKRRQASMRGPGLRWSPVADIEPSGKVDSEAPRQLRDSKVCVVPVHQLWRTPAFGNRMDTSTTRVIFSGVRSL